MKNLLKNPKIALAGSVNSSRLTLQKLIEHNLNICRVLGLDPQFSDHVSGFVDLKPVAELANIPFSYFKKINDPVIAEKLREDKPDFLFVIGFSQMIKKELLNIPKYGCIGFHPTKLPKGRGRGAVAWLILGKAPGAATFFVIDKGMDSGAIIAQQEFSVDDEDYAQDVIDKILIAASYALDDMLPKLKNGQLSFHYQDHSKATYLGKRNPKDGNLDWNKPATELYRLIRAVSSPLPGAYSYYNGQKFTINKASIEYKLSIVGVPGRVLKKDQEKGVLIQTGQGLLWLEKVQGISLDEIKIGRDLGLDFENEFLKLIEEVKNLKRSFNE